MRHKQTRWRLTLDQLGIDRLPDDALARLCTFRPCLPFSNATLWRKVASGEFPAPIKVSAGVTAWRVGSIREWLRDPNGYRSNSEQAETASPNAHTARRSV
jgi:prophage regulatory protein